MKRLFLFVLFGVFGFASFAFALPFYMQTQGLVPSANDQFFIGTSSPSTLEYNGIFVKNLNVSGTCTGCGGGGGSFPFTTQSTWVSTSTLVNFTGGIMSLGSSTIQSLLSTGATTTALSAGQAIFTAASTTAGTSTNEFASFFNSFVGNITAFLSTKATTTDLAFTQQATGTDLVLSSSLRPNFLAAGLMYANGSGSAVTSTSTLNVSSIDATSLTRASSINYASTTMISGTSFNFTSGTSSNIAATTQSTSSVAVFSNSVFPNQLATGIIVANGSGNAQTSTSTCSLTRGCLGINTAALNTILTGGGNSNNLIASTTIGISALDVTGNVNFVKATSTNLNVVTQFSYNLATGTAATSTFLNVGNNLVVGNGTSTFGSAVKAGCFTIDGSTCLSAGATGANPTATVGTAAVNGSSANFMRADAAPGINLTMTPTWTGLHIFNTGGIIDTASSTIQYFNSASTTIGNELLTGKFGIATGTPGRTFAMVGDMLLKNTTNSLSAFTIENAIGSTTFSVSNVNVTGANILDVSTSTATSTGYLLFGIFSDGRATGEFQSAQNQNRAMGTSTLSSGTVTVSNTLVEADSIILLTNESAGGTLGSLSVGTITAGTSFVINSSNVLDSSKVFWWIWKPKYVSN